MIGFAGLSHLGIHYSLATAERGFDVIGFDPCVEAVENLREGRFPVEEPGLDALFQAQKKRFRFTAEPRDLAGCDLVFIGLDIKTDHGNRSDTAPLLSLIRQIAPHLKSGSTLVVLSQVNPGFTRRLKEEFLTRQWNVEIFYQVETLIFGRAVERALHPERYMVGAENPKAALPPLFRAWHERFGCPVLVMRYESAELTKIAINFFLVSSVSTTNTLAEVCSHIGADWNEIAPALRLDARIGPKAYLTPGLGIAGGNLERDLITVQQLSAGSDSDTGIVDAWLQNSAHGKSWPERTLRLALAHRGQSVSSSTLAIWGLAYKENTHSTKNSPSLAFIAQVPDADKHAYDPVVKLDSPFAQGVCQCDSAIVCCDGADALLILTPWPEFRRANLQEVRDRMKGAVILDPFGMLDGSEAQAKGFDYYRLGVPSLQAAHSTMLA